MLKSGNVTIFVSDMDQAVHFYSQVLGLKLVNRYGNEWATIKAGDSLTIGLHPATKESPAGRKGSITIGFQVSEIHKVVSALKEKGVKFRGPIVDDQQILAANFEDPDGDELYLAEVKQQWTKHETGAGVS